MIRGNLPLKRCGFLKRIAYSLKAVRVSVLKLGYIYVRTSSHQDQCHTETSDKTDARWWEMLPSNIFVPSGLFQSKVLWLSLILQEDVVRLKSSIMFKISHSITLGQGFYAQATLKRYQGEGQVFTLQTLINSIHNQLFPKKSLLCTSSWEPGTRTELIFH